MLRYMDMVWSAVTDNNISEKTEAVTRRCTRSGTLLKKWFQLRCFPVNFSRTPPGDFIWSAIPLGKYLFYSNSLLRCSSVFTDNYDCWLTESVPLTISCHLYFLRISEVSSMLHYGSVGARSQYRMLLYIYQEFIKNATLHISLIGLDFVDWSV